MNHPPANAYLVLLGTWVGGEREGVLHALYLGVALVATWATWAAARELCARPGVAALAMVASPGFLVSATTIMADVPYTAAWTAAAAFWLRGHRALADGPAGRGPAGRAFVLASLAATLCQAFRYNGIALIPLLFVYGIAKQRRLGVWAAWLLPPVAAFLLYQHAFSTLYGHSALASAAKFVADAKSQLGVSAAAQAFSALVFLGGCFASLGFLAPFVFGRRAIVAAGVGAALLLGVSLLGVGDSLAPWAAPGVRPAVDLQVAILGAVGGLALALVIADWRERRSAESLLLGLWVLGTFLFTAFFNWTVNARSLVPALPALGILAARRLSSPAAGPDAVAVRERPLFGHARGPASPLLASSPWRERIALAAALALSLAVATADAAFAGRVRDAARETVARAGGRRLFFRGHWGWQWYLEQGGATPFDVANVKLEVGDLLATPDWDAAVLLPLTYVAPRGTSLMHRPRGLATIAPELGANFYASAGSGPLPFAFGPSSRGSVNLVEVTRPVTLRSDAPAP